MRLFSDQRAMLLSTYKNSGVQLGLDRATEAVNQAYRKIGAAQRWSYLHRRTQINTQAPYVTGTVGFTLATRTLTLTGGTFPTWAAQGTILFNESVYQVQQMVDANNLVLQDGRCPTTDIVSGQIYKLVQLEYLLPADYLRTEEFVQIGSWWLLRELQPGSMLQTARLFSQPSRPYQYSVRGSLFYHDRLALEFSPTPDANYTHDLTYFAKPRPPQLPYQYTTGTVSVSGTAVTGSGTNFTSNMVGCQLRLGSATAIPEGEFGPNGSLNEYTILAVNSATSITLQTAGITVSGYKYLIDDPIDIDRQSMDEYFCRCCEYEYEVLSRGTRVSEKEHDMNVALANAKARDIRLSPWQQGAAAYVPNLDAIVQGNLRASS